MSDALVDQIARAVLYEGYILYPYRPCVKTRQRWTFGGIFPQAYADSHGNTDPAAMQAQCLLAGNASATFSLTLRFLHLTDRLVEQAPAFERVASLRAGGTEHQSWQEAVEREVELRNVVLSDIIGNPRRHPFSFPGNRTAETLRDDGRIVGRLVREQQPLQGVIELSAHSLTETLTQLTLRIVNQTPIDQQQNRDQALMSSFASTHFIVTAQDVGFISLTDPPAPLGDAAAQCQNVGCWPVLVGEPDRTDTLLVSPIILPDYPQIAPESPGDLFDGCEIDEILTLRIMTLTDAEKAQAAAVDDRVRHLLQRTETLARDQLMNLHGAVRGLRPVLQEQQGEASHG